MTMLSDDEIYAMYNEPRSDAEMLEFARELITAHTAKLLANVEMPAAKYETTGDIKDANVFNRNQLQQYAAAVAAQARVKALDEAKEACLNLYANLNDDLDCRKHWPEQLRVNTIYADAIESLKGGE